MMPTILCTRYDDKREPTFEQIHSGRIHWDISVPREPLSHSWSTLSDLPSPACVSLPYRISKLFSRQNETQLDSTPPKKVQSEWRNQRKHTHAWTHIPLSRRGVEAKMYMYSLVQWTWFSDVSECSWITCIQWRQRTNFTTPGCILIVHKNKVDWQDLAKSKNLTEPKLIKPK